MRARLFVQALLAGTMLVVAVAPPADAHLPHPYAWAAFGLTGAPR